MEFKSDWYDKTEKEIGSQQDMLGQKEYKKYKLNLLMRIARRVADFSPTCGQCQLHQGDITGLTQSLRNLSLMSKEGRKGYFKQINSLTEHLKKAHKLVTKGQYMGMWMSLGSGIGVAIGAGIDNIGAGTGLGVAIGLGVGKYLDNKAAREGRVI